MLRIVISFLRAIPPSIGALEKLHTLTISSSRLHNKGIPASLGKLKNLEVLNIDDAPDISIGDSITHLMLSVGLALVQT